MDPAFNELKGKKEGHSKMKGIKYDSLKIQNYMKNPNLNSGQIKNLFKFRTRMSKVKCNSKNKYSESLNCPLCDRVLDTPEHLLQCDIIKEKGEE